MTSLNFLIIRIIYRLAQCFFYYYYLMPNVNSIPEVNLLFTYTHNYTTKPLFHYFEIKKIVNYQQKHKL